MPKDYKLDKGVFVVSLDLELAWGTRGDKSLEDDYKVERSVIKDLLDMFKRYEISATWATVGHLFLDKCSLENGVKHPEIVRPDFFRLKGDWFDVDPASDLSSDPLWYGPDILNMIKSCPVLQEIGCHTFSHVHFNKELNKDCFDSELRACRMAASPHNIDLKSFVFPKNQIGFLQSLKDFGFICFRGKDENWYGGLPHYLKKIAHAIDNYFIPTTPVVEPKFINGLWNIPGSYFYPHARSWARFLPASMRVRKVKSGLCKAAKENKIFHLWFHPFNLSSDRRNLMNSLENIFSEFKELRDKGLLDNKTMLSLAESL